MKFLKYSSLTFLFFLTFSLKAQKQKFGFELMDYLHQVENQDEMVPLLVEGKTEEISNLIKELGGDVRLKVGLLYSIDIPAKNVEVFSAHPFVKQIDFSLAPAHALSDTMLINTRAKSVHEMLGSLRKKYSGKGVVIGIIDTGIEIEHPDFMDLDSNTKILYIWDQNATHQPNRKANNYNYGVEWTSASIENKSCTHVDHPQYFGHGSNVTGTAASSGMANGNYRGVAPEAKIISVATRFGSVNWLQTVAEAVDYIFSKADSMGLPCVINTSVGTYEGSHDGLDIAARMIDQMLQQKGGRALVSAAGNEGTQSFHLQHNLQNDSLFTWFEQHNILPNNQRGVVFEVWSDTADFNNISYSFGADEHQNSNYKLRGRTAFAKGKNRLNQVYTDTIFSIDNNRLALVQTFVDSAQGRYNLQVRISVDSTQYHYRFETTGNGKLDIWSSYALLRHSNIINSTLPSAAVYSEMYKYKKPDSLQTIVSSFAALPSVITVGNYVNRGEYIDVNHNLQKTGWTAGEISINSSLGPNRKGVLKPDISSSGDYLFAAGKISTLQQAILNDPKKVTPDSMHYRNGGTSLASPTVAGIVALLLEQCPELNYSSIKSAIINSARIDQFTSNLPNPKWGHGKADAFALLEGNVFTPKLNVLDSPSCEGDSIRITTTENYFKYKWSHGDQRAITKIARNDTIMVWAIDSNSCQSPSDTLILTFIKQAKSPQIHQIEDSLFLLGNTDGVLQWFHNQQAIPQANQDFYIADQAGLYYCQRTDSNGCSTFSDSIYYQIVGIEKIENTSWEVYPNPVKDGKLNITSPFQGGFNISLYNINGRKLLEKHITEPQKIIQLPSLSKGLYLLKGRDNKGNTFSKKIQIL